MKNVHAFLIGLLLSLCALPVFAACPPGMTGTAPDCYLGETLYDLSGGMLEFDVNNDVYGSWLKVNTTFDFSTPPDYDEVWFRYVDASFNDGSDGVAVIARTADHRLFEYMTFITEEGYYLTADSFFTEFSFGGGVPVSSNLFELPSGYISGGLATLAIVCVLILGPKIFKWGGKQTISMFNDGDRTFSSDYKAISMSALDKCDESIARFNSLP